MPNHVVNELIFRNLTPDQKAEILAKTVNAEGRVDFSILLPKPINCWDGNVGQVHQKRFKIIGMDWARENWGTKWNAYDCQPVVVTDDGLVMVFETAWSPPFGWLLAIFNGLKASFEHNWYDEGSDRGHHAIFDYALLDGPWDKEPWVETVADETLFRHLHKLRWGVEEFEPEEDA